MPFLHLSEQCHQLKSLELKEVNYLGLDKLLKVNRNLVSVNIELCYSEDPTFMGDIFEILGQCCPLIQDCELNSSSLHATDIQIDTFTKGCINLKSLIVETKGVPSRFIYKLFHSLSSNSAALGELKFYNYGDDNDGNIVSVLSDQSIRLQSLSKGFPLLHELHLKCLKNLSTSNISYLLNHTPKLGDLDISNCNLCKDGGVITKYEGKLNHLDRLKLNNKTYITDEVWQI